MSFSIGVADLDEVGSKLWIVFDHTCQKCDQKELEVKSWTWLFVIVVYIPCKWLPRGSNFQQFICIVVKTVVQLELNTSTVLIWQLEFFSFMWLFMSEHNSDSRHVAYNLSAVVIL